MLFKKYWYSISRGTEAIVQTCLIEVTDEMLGWDESEIQQNVFLNDNATIVDMELISIQNMMLLEQSCTSCCSIDECDVWFTLPGASFDLIISDIQFMWRELYKDPETGEKIIKSFQDLLDKEQKLLYLVQQYKEQLTKQFDDEVVKRGYVRIEPIQYEMLLDELLCGYEHVVHEIVISIEDGIGLEEYGYIFPDEIDDSLPF